MGCGSSQHGSLTDSGSFEQPAKKPDQHPTESEEEKPDQRPTESEEEKLDQRPTEPNEKQQQKAEETFEMTEFHLDSLLSHNHYRYRHGVAPLKLNPELCRIAQAHADKLIRENKFQHSDSKDRKLDGHSTGESIFSSSSTKEQKAEGRRPVDAWYSEVSVYEYEQPEFKKATGHFTQLVWADSKELGMAYAQGKDGAWHRTVVVANYFPAGNVKGSFQANVPPVDPKHKK